MNQSRITEIIDTFDPETGEIKEWKYQGFDPEIYEGYVIRKGSRKPKKALENFNRFTRGLRNLTIQERGLFQLLTEYIGWEDNFVQKDTKHLTIQDITTLSGLTKKTILLILQSLEEKELIVIVDFGNRKTVYMYSRYVWFGHEKNRNDIKLYDLLCKIKKEQM